MDPTAMPADAPASVLYRFWPHADPPKLEFLSAGAEDVMEATAAEAAAMLADGRLPLVGADPAAFYAAVAASVRDHRPWQAEFGYAGPRTGRVRWLQAADFPQTAADGTRYFLGTLLDVTARRDAEAAERAAAARLEAHVANTPLAVVEWDPGFRITRWTGAAEGLFGWAAAEALGRRWDEFPLVHPDDVGRVAEVCRRLAAGEERRGVVFNRNRTKAGRVLWCEWHNSAILGPDGRVASVLSLALDRTPAAEAQAAVARSDERLRAALRQADMLGWERDLVTGRMHYSGDRHEFYGPADDPDDPYLGVVHPADRERVGAAFAAAVRDCGPVAVEFRGAGRTPDGRPRWFLARGQVQADPAGRPVRAIGVTADITDRVRAVEEWAALDRALHAARRRPACEHDPHALNNALAAVTGYLELAAERLAGHPAADLVGAALAACGRVADLLRPPPPPAAPAGRWRAAGRALVADDEANARELTAAILEEAGFTVTRAADGAAALAAVRADPADYRLVVTDVLMPGLEGDALVRRLRADRPGLPAVLMTGFLNRPVDPAVLAAPATRLLAKPFRADHLLAAARAVCEAATA